MAVGEESEVVLPVLMTAYNVANLGCRAHAKKLPANERSKIASKAAELR